MIGRRQLLIWPVSTLAIRMEGQIRDAQRLTFTGIGPVRIGMTEAQVRSVLKLQTERTDFEEGCSYLTGADQGVAFMLLDPRVARVDIMEGPRLTEAGAGIGTSETEIHRLYPRVRTEPHPYLDRGEGYYLRVQPAAPKLRNYELLFETY